MTPREHAIDRIRRLLRRIDRLIAHDAPGFLIAGNFVMLTEMMTLYCGAELYAEMGRLAVAIARDRNGFCQHCDQEIGAHLTHPPICEACDFRFEEEYREMGGEG